MQARERTPAFAPPDGKASAVPQSCANNISGRDLGFVEKRVEISNMVKKTIVYVWLF